VSRGDKIFAWVLGVSIFIGLFFFFYTVGMRMPPPAATGRGNFDLGGGLGTAPNGLNGMAEEEKGPDFGKGPAEQKPAETPKPAAQPPSPAGTPKRK